jgi:tRNA(Ile2) C34 agmatinyltransferase TiaS
MQNISDHSPLPVCPGCARPMTPVSDKDNEASPLRSFRCRNCGTAFSEAAWLQSQAPDRALTLNFDASSRPH